MKIVHKENGTIWRKGWCWNLHKVDIQISVLQVHWPDLDSKAKIMENCRYTTVPIWKRLKIIFSYSFLLISSIFSEQSQKCVKNTKLFTMEQDIPLWGENQVPHSCQAWWRQKCLSIAMTLFTKIIYCNRMENEMKSCQIRQIEQIFKCAQDSCMFMKSGSISWRKTLKNSCKSQIQWLVVSTFCQETKEFTTKRMHPRKHQKLDPYWKLQPVACTISTELRSEFFFWTKIILTPGSEFFMDHQVYDEFEQQRAGNRRSSTRRILHCDQRTKQNYKNVDSYPRTIFIGKEFGLMLNQGNIHSPIIQCRRNWSIFFVMEIYLETIMEQLNTEEYQIIFRIIFVLSSLVWQKVEEEYIWQDEGTTKKISVLFCFLRNNSFFITLQDHSESNLIDPTLQDNVLTPNNFFEYIFHVGCAINFNSVINSGLIPGGQNLSNRQTKKFLPVDPMDEDHRNPNKIDLEARRLTQYTHKAWKKHQNAVYWVDIHLPLEKDWSSFKNDRTLSFVTKHSSISYSRSCSDGKWRSHFREDVYVSPISSKNFLETWLDDKIVFRSCSTNRKRSYSTSNMFPVNPIQTQTTKRWNQLFTMMKVTSVEPLFTLRKRLILVSRVKVRTFFWKTKNIDKKGKSVVCPQDGASQTRFSRDKNVF